jgi:hypothetical protein
MKKLITLTLLSFCSLGLMAQSDPMERIYDRYSGDKVSIRLNLDASIFDDFDIDIDTDEVRQQMSGTIDRVRFIRFEDFRPGLRYEKEIIEELFALGYEAAQTPRDWEDDDSQMLAFTKKGQEVSPHLIIIINDHSDREATVLIFSGAIIFKSSAS